MDYQNIIVETRGKVGLVTLNRPKALNALNDDLVDEPGGPGRPDDPVEDGAAAERQQHLPAVAGFALGGGCEMAMMCDMIFAADTAKFGQPEVKLGIIPGAGGTQRLPRAVGKGKAMDLCLTARLMDAAEAEKSGLVARVIPADKLVEEALAAAAAIASYSLPVVMMIKESINRAFESSLNEGLLFERRTFHSAFALADQKEGMAAFVEKRKADFKNE